MYLPALEAVDGTELALALVNSGSTDAQVAIAARTYDGEVVAGVATFTPYTLTVPAAGKLQIRLSDLFGSGITNQHGWLEITPSTSDVKVSSFVFDSSLTFVEGIDVTSETSNQLIFPKISQGSGTTLRLVNTSAQGVNATISLYDNLGNIAAVFPLSLPALSGMVRTADELTLTNPGFEGYAVVQNIGASMLFSRPSLIGFEAYRNQTDFAVVRGIPVSAQMKNGYWSQFLSQGGYSSRLTLINTADTSQVLQITADGMPGAASITQTLTLLPGERVEQSVADMFKLSGSSLIAGDLRFQIQGDTPGVVSTLEYSATDGTLLSAAQPQSNPQSDFYFTHLSQSADYYTGLALVNPNAEPSTVLMDLFDKSGMVTASTTLSLAPGERQAGTLAELFGKSIAPADGYIRGSSPQPIFAQEMLRSNDSTGFLANVPASGNDGTQLIVAMAKTNPVPSILSLQPSQAVIDNLTSLNIRISGSGFRKGSIVNYDGVALTTQYINSSLLAITLAASQLTAAAHSIQVFNPAPGGGLSNTVTILLSYSSGPSMAITTVAPGLALDNTTVVQGQTLNGSVTLQNTSSSPITINKIAITSRPPGGTNVGGPFDDFSPVTGPVTIQPQATQSVSASRTFTTSDPPGTTWYAYATYQDTAGAWHDGSTVNFTVSAPSQPAVSVSISPGSASVQAGSTQQFTATVTGATNTAVTWAATSGTITTSGLYTAPSTAGTYTVTATSQQDTTKNASATVTVTAPSSNMFFGTLPPGSALPSDAYCAANVTSSAWEPRPGNSTANNTIGANVGIGGAPSSINSRIDGNFTGTTNQILQWSACKWGFDEDIMRAQAVQETHWNQNGQGDYTTDATLCSKIGKTAPCYQSYGILQIKSTLRTGTYPLSQNSTPFNADWSRAFLRFCYEGDITWLGGTYAAGDLWGCIGWYFSGGWYDSGAVSYINSVKSYYSSKPWLQTGF
jgi:autotransporter family porin